MRTHCLLLAVLVYLISFLPAEGSNLSNNSSSFYLVGSAGSTSTITLEFHTPDFHSFSEFSVESHLLTSLLIRVRVSGEPDSFHYPCSSKGYNNGIDDIFS